MKALLAILVVFVLAPVIGVLLLDVARRFPIQTLVLAIVFAISGISVFLYIGELVVIGWVVDFLSEIGMPAIQAKSVPLECEQVGEILVVMLPDNIATIHQCQSVEKQLNRLIDEHHCDFVLDFSQVRNISRRFRAVMVRLMKRARREAAKLGKPYRPVALSRGEVFRVFVDRQRAVEAMSQHDGHGWVVLCSVPVGIRAVSGIA